MTIRQVSAVVAAAVAVTCVMTMAPPASVATTGAVVGIATADPPPTCPTPVAQPGATMTPPSRAPMGQGAHFSYPNRSSAERVAIRNRVVNTINSTWGRWYTPKRESVIPGCEGTITGWDVHRGTIRMTTWSFNDWGVRNALVRAAQRGASVQIIAAKGINATGVDGKGPYKPWVSVRNWLRSNPGDHWIARTASRNYAWDCSGACRGRGGTPHSKFFLFNDVASTANAHVAKITVQTSMNLTGFAYKGQWNQAVVTWNARVYDRFLQVFKQMAAKQVHGYEATSNGGVHNFFYPGGSLSKDPVLRALNRVRCTGAASGGIRGRTRIRVIQYAIHDTRGTTIAKKLRGLWNAGCDVRVIYSVTSRPVLKILRARSGRGPVPMKQSVIKNRAGEIVKYNHSKWLAIGGRYGASRGTWTVLSGSANWSNFAYACDEQMQQMFGSSWTNPFFATFDRTWKQKTSRPPQSGRASNGARMPPEPVIGQGIYKYMEND